MKWDSSWSNVAYKPVVVGNGAFKLIKGKELYWPPNQCVMKHRITDKVVVLNLDSRNCIYRKDNMSFTLSALTLITSIEIQLEFVLKKKY